MAESPEQQEAATEPSVDYTELITELLGIPNEGDRLGELLEFSFLTSSKFADNDPFIPLAQFIPEDLKAWAHDHIEGISSFLSDTGPQHIKNHLRILRDTARYEKSAWFERVRELLRMYPLSREFSATRLAVRHIFLEAESRLADHAKQVVAEKAAKVATQASVETNESAA